MLGLRDLGLKCLYKDDHSNAVSVYENENKCF